MRLLNLPASVQELISAGSLTMGQVRPLIGHHDAAALAQLILTDNLSARDVEQLIKGMKSGAKAATKNPEKSSDIRALEDKAMQILGLSLSLSWDEAKERGKLSISMSSLEQLDDLMARLGLADDNPS
jgi:ParB family chromosome partitioning protein